MQIFIATKILLYIASSQLLLSSTMVRGGRGFRKAGTINETAVNNQEEDRYLGHQLL